MVADLRSKLTGFFVNGHERTLLAKKNIALAFLIRGGGILISLILVPMTINYVSPAQYGIWLTISSIIGWLSFFDVGLGNGLRNELAHSLATGETEKARVFVSTTYVALALIAGSILILFSVANPYINWSSILNVTTEKEETLRLVIWVAVSCFCVQFVIQLINTILAATHQSANASFITFFGQLFTLATIYYCTQYVRGSLLTLVAIVASTPVIALFVATFILFRNKLHTLSPSFRLVNFSYARNLLNTGGVFFFIQIGALVLFQTNYIIISQILGPEQVTTFSVCYKLFSVTIMVFTIIMTPLWSSFTDAYAKSDFNWLRSSIQKMRKLWLLFSAITLLILCCSQYIFENWLGKGITVPWSLSICMTVYVIAYIWQMLHVYLLNGISKIRLQLILVTISALLNIPIAVLLGKRFGLAGIVSANTIFFVVMGIIFSIQCEKIIQQRATEIWNK
jgi:O-antigen/teichoic acid export membrane protein